MQGRHVGGRLKGQRLPVLEREERKREEREKSEEKKADTWAPLPAMWHPRQRNRAPKSPDGQNLAVLRFRWSKLSSFAV
jgi:hypothetical protein